MVGTFAPIDCFGRLMAGFSAPWFVSGGWAIDLARDRVTRDHEDLEIGVFRRDQGALQRHLAGWTLAKAVHGPRGDAWTRWAAGE